MERLKQAESSFSMRTERVNGWEVWSYDSVTGEWVEPKPQHYATFSLDLPLDAEIIENDFFS